MQNKIYVGNLSYTAREQELRDYFSTYGEVTEVFVPKDRETGKGRGFAFVTFASSAQAEDALKADGKELLDRTLKVNIAKERESNDGRSRGAR
jgi:RNA recognition motif-containing protein